MRLLRELTKEQLGMINRILDNPFRLDPKDRARRRPPSTLPDTCARGHVGRITRYRKGARECLDCKAENTATWRRRMKGFAA